MHFSFADLDNLKNINDVYGHEAGDEIITMAATILQEEAPKGCVARYGGDEFIIFGTAFDKEGIEEYWSRVQHRIDAYNSVRDGAKLSLSYGYHLFDVEGKTSLDDCILVVDRTMYEQKRNKKNRNR
jgi:diguanylate cyclase (GGDEF)-like protein